MSTKPSNLPVNQLMGLIRMLPPELKQTLAQLLAQETGQDAAQLDEEDLELWEEDDEEEDWYEDWDEDEGWDEEDEGLERRMLLAAETFGYNYASYEDKLGNPRFDELLPREVDILEQAETDGWDDARLAESLETAVEEMPLRRRLYRRAVQIIDAPSPAEAFRRAVRFSIEDAVAEGLKDQEAIENLVAEICSRAADLGYLLDVTGEPLSLYSRELCLEDELTPHSPLPGDQTGG